MLLPYWKKYEIDERMELCVNIARRSFLGSAISLSLLAGCRMPKSLFSLDKSFRFEFGDDDKFVFFAVSDWHRTFKTSDTDREIAFFKRAVAKYSPKLVVFGGDNVSHCQNKIGLFEDLMEPVIDAFKETGVRLAVGFGNHDSEHGLTESGFYSRKEQYDWFKDELGDLFVDYNVSRLTGVGTGKIEIFKKGAPGPSFKIYIADSGAYAWRDSLGKYNFWKGYDNPHSDQIAWYLEDSFDAVPHVWIQHIIVPDANCNGIFIKATENEFGAVRKFSMPDGSVETMKLAQNVMGVCKERTCPPKWSVYRDARHVYNSMTLYDAWRMSGTMKGAFFGHDHMNTFDGVDNNGIRLGMIKSMNCGGSYNDGEAGMRVFIVNSDGTYETETITERTCM